MAKPTRTVPANDYCPAAGYLLIQPEVDAAISDGGIHIPDQARKTLNEGQVLKVGADCGGYAVGMFVVFEPASEHELEIEKGVRVLVVHINNVLMYRHHPQSLFPARRPTEKGKFCDQHFHPYPCPVCEKNYKEQSQAGGGIKVGGAD